MARNNIYRITYHFALNGKRTIGPFNDFVQASAPTKDAITTVLANNGITAPGGYTLDIEVIANGPAPTFLS